MRDIDCPCVLTIAGTDPSGGAGAQADIKAISATGAYAASVITALVAQNTQGVQAICEVGPCFITEQLGSVFNDLTVRAVKIGMLHNEETVEVIALALEKFKPKQVVFDPVMVSKNGCELLRPTVVPFMKERLFPLVDLITPNLYEAEKIIEEKISSMSEMESAAKRMSDHFNLNVLLKGGHLIKEESSDVLSTKEQSHHALLWFHEKRIETKNTHGTGCTLSSAIASFLAQGHPLKDAVYLAKKYLTRAIETSDHLKIGKGAGPVNHFYFLKEAK
jgi:hydroxymethylpyrimidine/phosphomethylpyrimidine kinase